MEIKYEFEPEEVIQDFKLIGETFSRSIVKTGKGRRMYDKLITSKGYDDIAVGLINKAKYAYSHGLANDTVLTLKQIVVLKALVTYCVGL